MIFDATGIPYLAMKRVVDLTECSVSLHGIMIIPWPTVPSTAYFLKNLAPLMVRHDLAEQSTFL